MSREEAQNDIQIPWKDEGNMDMVEVVRCKDCKRWNTVVDRSRAEYGLCQNRSQLEATKREDYCSYGEKQDG